MSYDQFKQKTGIKGRATISKALDGLEEKGYINRRGVKRGSIWYSLNQELEIEISSSSEIKPDASRYKDGLVQKLNQSSSVSELDEVTLVQKLNTCKDNLKDNLKDTSSTTPAQTPSPQSVELGQCISAYRNEIGPLGPMQLEDLKYLYDGLSPPPLETKLDWFKYAVLETRSNGKNNWKYTRSILDRINTRGSLEGHREDWRKRNGQTATRNGEYQTNGTPRQISGEPSSDHIRRYNEVNDANIASFERKLFN